MVAILLYYCVTKSLAIHNNVYAYSLARCLRAFHNHFEFHSHACGYGYMYAHIHNMHILHIWIAIAIYL